MRYTNHTDKIVLHLGIDAAAKVEGRDFAASSLPGNWQAAYCQLLTVTVVKYKIQTERQLLKPC